jgi:formate-dependent nitrite reductase membrane component NrfD
MSAAERLQLLRSDLAQVYRPQREWIEGRGILIVVAHFLSGVGAGAWLLSTAFGYAAGAWLGLFFVGALSGVAHLGFLGRPERFWRVVRRPHESWISRGIWSIGVFLAAGGALALFAPPSGSLRTALAGVAALGALGVLLYEGFVYAASIAIPFWRTPLLPLLYVAYGVRGGAALLLVAAAIAGATFDVEALEAIKLWVVASTGLLVALLLLAARSRGGAAEAAMRRLVAGSISPAFYGGTILVGIAVPLALGAARALGATGLAVLAAIGVASLVGDFYVKYCVVKAGVYVPTVGALGTAPQSRRANAL